jgi:hypothetical protein
MVSLQTFTMRRTTGVEVALEIGEWMEGIGHGFRWLYPEVIGHER